ncbi:hypothetical protein A4X03_0g9863, partial [Tilletia caries]
SHAIIWFDTNGVVKGANQNFCQALGYSLSEIVGQHHRIFIEKREVERPEYQKFWRDLASGKAQHGQFRRVSKTGSDVWIEASYDPVIRGGRVVGVVKIAADITKSKIAALHNENILKTLERSVAVIEFDLDGTIVTANSSFLGATGYTLEEIVGKKHRIFCDPAYADSKDYGEFWERLNGGETIADTFRRFGKGKREIWLQATYNPVYSSKGTAGEIAQTATELRESAGGIAKRTEQQAAALEQTSAALEEITQTVSDSSMRA